MKKCSYCNKELLQGQELCNSFCKTQAQKYQRFFERWKTCFAVLSLVGMLLALAGAVMAFFDVPFAFCVLGGSLVLLGSRFALVSLCSAKAFGEAWDRTLAANHSGCRYYHCGLRRCVSVSYLLKEW